MAANSSVVAAKQKQKKKKANTKVWFWAAECKYEVILGNVRELGWKTVEDERCESKANLYWIDVAAIHERFRTIQPWQTINHFPGMPNIARKNRMGQNLNRMLKMFPVRFYFGRIEFLVFLPDTSFRHVASISCLPAFSHSSYITLYNSCYFVPY
jgi:hypothetical protein